MPRCVSTPSCGCSASEGGSTRRRRTSVRRPRLLRVLRAQEVPELRNEQHNSQHNRSNAQPGAGQPLLCQVLLRAGVGACACQHRRDAAAPRAHRSASRLEGAAHPRAAARRVQASQPVERSGAAVRATRTHRPHAVGKGELSRVRPPGFCARKLRARTQSEGRDGLPGVPPARRAQALTAFSCTLLRRVRLQRVAGGPPCVSERCDAPGLRAAQQSRGALGCLSACGLLAAPRRELWCRVGRLRTVFSHRNHVSRAVSA